MTRPLLVFAIAFISASAQADPEDLRPAPPAPGAPAAPAAAQVATGDQLYTEGRFREAAAQYEAAYTIDPNTVILERLANAYERAGDLDRAGLLRRRIEQLRAPPPPQGYDVIVQPVPPPRPPVPAVPRHVRIGSSLLRTGLGLFTGGYTSAVISGAVGLSVSSDPDPFHTASKMMFIPVVGPFISTHWESDAIWVFPVVLNGVMQLAGLSLSIAGAAIMGSHHKPATQLTVAPFSTGTTNGLSFSGSF